ncbi:MAG: glycoside hydrolase family 95 protein [bacterium]|nr:glycoside hydrolase family 95 protein [bacterium]
MYKRLSAAVAAVFTANLCCFTVSSEGGTFGSEYRVIKEFDTSSLAETDIGDTGYKLSTSSSNYNNAVIRDKSSENTGYYPYGNGLPERGYYLFLGSGGNGGVNAELTLPDTAEAGKYIRLTYAKPKATNNGTAERSSVNNDNSIEIGTETINLKENCEFDNWYTTTVKLNENISSVGFKLGRWSAAAVAEAELADSADTMELTVQGDVTSRFITDEEQTVKYTANVYNSITTPADSEEIVSRGTVDTSAHAEYSAGGYPGVTIDETGLLTITPQAQPGTVTITAQYGEITKTAELVLEAVSDADSVAIVGDELVSAGGSYSFKAVPAAEGNVIPERDTEWSIEGETHGCSIENGMLTVPQEAEPGNITIKAVLAVNGSQVSENVSDTMTVTIRNERAAQPYLVKGVFLTDGAADAAAAEGIEGIIIDAESLETGCNAVVKAMDKNGIIIAEESAVLSPSAAGVQEIKINMSFKNASAVKAYIINADNEIISDIFKTDKGEYKNVPLVSDWITGAKSGLGMGAGIITPNGAPYGVDPELVDVSKLKVRYTYDDNYPVPSADNALWYKTGAYLAGNSSGNNSIYARDGADWEQKALPIGNGYMGGMLFGLPDKDQIQINEETFWAAGYRGTQTEVNENDVNKNMSEGINGFMSVGNIFVDFNMPEDAAVNNYYRDLNLDESVAHVQYEYDGTLYKREYFASYPKEVLAFRYTAGTERALNFDVKPVSMHPGEVTVNDGEITIIGKLKDSEPYSSGGNAAWNQESDLEYCTKIKVIADDGVVTDGYNTVNISNASGVTILVAAATDYDANQFELNDDGSVNMEKTPYKSVRGIQAAIDKANARINGAAAMSYVDLKAEHIADYKAQFDTVKFTLTDENEICTTPTDELQKAYDRVVKTEKGNDGTTKVAYDERAYKGLDKHLEELHYNYARYMMISSSRSTTMPATLQGKWCQSVAEIWGSCYCININMEMNYWFAGGANLLDSTKSLIGWFNSQIPAGRITAKNMYKVTPKSYKFEDGKMTFTDSADEADDVFIMHTKQAIMGTTDLTGSTSIQSAGNTAWLMYNLWDIYQTTGDKELLKNDLYPIMRKAANFYTQYLYTNERKATSDTEKYPDGYYYTTWEGRSPEQGPTHEGIKYDLQLVAGMYDYTIAAAQTLGIDGDKAAAWKEIRNHLELPVELGDEGQIKEWAEETLYNTDSRGNALGDPVHRHISHLVGLYPGTLINRDTPELLDGAKLVLRKRGDDSTGWSCSNKFLLWARTLEGDKALELFRYQLAKKTYSNLFDTHAPFQIDGNFGSAAGVMELLMQSQTGDIYILPALPSAWDKGEISGIKAKNGAAVDIKWVDNEAESFTITPAVDGDITIGYDKQKGTFKVNGDAYADMREGKKYTIKDAKAGTAYTFTATEPSIEPTEPPVDDKTKIVITDSSVSVKNASEGVLVIAGYGENGELVKTRIAEGLSMELNGYDTCQEIRAFLWNSVSGMEPLAERASLVKTN